MGLDMYAYAIKEKPPKEVDFEEPDRTGEWEAWAASGFKDETAPYFFYWRKHPDLHGWMEKLYDEKGGRRHGFNGDPLMLTPEDLTRLEADVQRRMLPHTTGFFFGQSSPEDRKRDLEFIGMAREKIAAGYTVYYTSSW